MPGLKAFGRRWDLGSDDLVIPSLLEGIIRITWVISIAVVFAVHQDSLAECPHGDVLKTFYIGSLTIFSCHIVLSVVTGYVATSGTIINVRPRRHMSKLIYLKIVLGVPEIAWNILGSYWAFDESMNCETHVVHTVEGVVVAGWVLAIGIVIGTLIVFDPMGAINTTPGRSTGTPREGTDELESLESGDYDQTVTGVAAAASKMWRNRCRFLCCCCVGCDEQSNNAFSDVGKVLAEFFHDTDVVPSDIAAGLILLQMQQEKEEARLISEGVPRSRTTPLIASGPSARVTRTSSTDSPDPNVPPNIRPKEWMSINNMAHYMKYAQASYGWPLYIFSNLFTGAFRLGGAWTFESRHNINIITTECCLTSAQILDQENTFGDCCACVNPSASIHVVEDNCCHCHTAAIRKTVDIEPENIIYASFHNKIFEIPFFVALDHEKQSVIVAVRGTLSLRDVLTDLSADSCIVDVDGIDTCHSHKGMMQAAKFIQRKLEERMILNRAFEKAPGYKLVITGHSLGAGTAALLAVLLKPSYPDLICFSFSPPGGLMSLCLAKSCQEYICSVVLGKDVVPRLGIVTMEDLKVKLLRAIKDCDKPKHRVFATGCWNVVCKFSPPQPDEAARRPLIDSSDNTTNYNSAAMAEFEQSLQNAISKHRRCKITTKDLYPPGQVVHIVEEEPAISCWSVPTYSAMWTNNESFQDIIVSPRMLSDHMPDAVQKALDQLQDNSVAVQFLETDPRCSSQGINSSGDSRHQ